MFPGFLSGEVFIVWWVSGTVWSLSLVVIFDIPSNSLSLKLVDDILVLTNKSVNNAARRVGSITTIS